MKINGEYLFNSFEEALSYVNRPTNYEKTHNIIVQNTEIVFDSEDIKLVERVSSDKQISLFIFFKNSTLYDIWKFWCPSRKQFSFLVNHLPKHILNTEMKNAKYWGKK